MQDSNKLLEDGDTRGYMSRDMFDGEDKENIKRGQTLSIIDIFLICALVQLLNLDQRRLAKIVKGLSKKGK